MRAGGRYIKEKGKPPRLVERTRERGEPAEPAAKPETKPAARKAAADKKE